MGDDNDTHRVEYIALVSLVRVPQWPQTIGLVVLEHSPKSKHKHHRTPHLQVYWTDGPADDEGGTNELMSCGYLRDYPGLPEEYGDNLPRVKLVTTAPEQINAWAPVVLDSNRWWLGDDAVSRIFAAPVQRLGRTP